MTTICLPPRNARCAAGFDIDSLGQKGSMADPASVMSQRTRQKNRKKTKILLADREAIFRLGLKKVLSAEDDLRVVAQAETVPQVLAMIATFRPDLAIIQEEIVFAEGQNLVGKIHHHAEKCKIIAIATLFSEQTKKELIQAGASGLLCRAERPEVFGEAVRKVILGEKVFPQEPLARQSVRITGGGNRGLRPVDTLTNRERTIVSWLTQGCRNREIATRLEIREQTVKNHLRSIFDKVGVSDRLELVLYAIHQRLELPPVL